jgi:hypothetical protein
MEPVYCVGNVTLSDGQVIPGTYYLNETYPNGNLKLNKATIDEQLIGGAISAHFGDTIIAPLIYTNEPMWIENGVVKSGYEDRKDQFYNSNLYRGIFLNQIPGFDLVYNNGAVKIYKIKE